MLFGSVCSGIEAASVAWHPLGWRAAWLAEIERFPAAVLAHHYPTVPNLGDMTKIAKQILTGAVEAPDVLVGGTPCQAFSMAGMREGLADERGQLTIKYVELADAIDLVRQHAGKPPAIDVWENVPGVLSSKDNAFGCFLAALAGEDEEIQPPGKKWENAGCVFGPARTVAWRVLDAQYFGVAQRRRRVFVVASARKDFDPTAVLFEFDGVRRDTAPSREAGQEVAGTLTRCAFSGGAGGRPDGAIHGHFQPVGYRMVAFGEYADDGTASTMKARDYKDATDLAVMSVHGTQDPDVRVEHAHTLGRNNGQENAITHGMAVRRLTPTECERLQGFPDGYTQVPYRKKPAADGPRYKALGNSMAVPCMRWIGQRIQIQLRPAGKQSDSSTTRKGSINTQQAESMRKVPC